MPMGVMYLHARTFFTIADTTSIPIGAMYFYARLFWTLAYMSCIPMGAMYFTCKNILYTCSYDFYTLGCDVFHARTLCTFSDTILYRYRLWAPVFTVITEVWPSANRAVVTNNLTFIIGVFWI